MCIRDRYERYGYYKDDIQSITLKGIEGLAKIQEILETLRKNPPAEIAGYKAVSYTHLICTTGKTGISAFGARDREPDGKCRSAGTDPGTDSGAWKRESLQIHSDGKEGSGY